MSVLDEIRPEWDALRDGVKELEEMANMQRAEVKRLRRKNAELIDEIDHLLIKRQHIEDVNAKLRELLSSYWKAVHSPVTTNVPRDYLKEMRELGVEVE